MRELLLPAFSGDALRKSIPQIAATAKQLCAGLVQSQQVDIQLFAKSAMLDIIGLVSFNHSFGAVQAASNGIHSNAGTAILQQLNEAQLGIRYLGMDLPGPDWLMPGYKAYAMCSNLVNHHVASIVEEQLQRSSLQEDDDMLALMLRQYQLHGRPTLVEICNEMKTIIFAGALHLP